MKFVALNHASAKFGNLRILANIALGCFFSSNLFAISNATLETCFTLSDRSEVDRLQGLENKLVATDIARLHSAAIRTSLEHPMLVSGQQLAKLVDASQFIPAMQWMNDRIAKKLELTADLELKYCSNPKVCTDDDKVSLGRIRSALNSALTLSQAALNKGKVSYFELSEVLRIFARHEFSPEDYEFKRGLLRDGIGVKPSAAENRIDSLSDDLMKKFPFHIVVPVTEPISIRQFNDLGPFEIHLIGLVDKPQVFDGGLSLEFSIHDFLHALVRAGSLDSGVQQFVFRRRSKAGENNFSEMTRENLKHRLNEIEARIKIYEKFKILRDSDAKAKKQALYDVIWFFLDHELNIPYGGPLRLKALPSNHSLHLGEFNKRVKDKKDLGQAFRGPLPFTTEEISRCYYDVLGVLGLELQK